MNNMKISKNDSSCGWNECLFQELIFDKKSIYQGTGISKLVKMFCDVDDFCKVFVPQW
jgi:hypothetical protein